jgi:hypothetical protein
MFYDVKNTIEVDMNGNQGVIVVGQLLTCLIPKPLSRREGLKKSEVKSPLQRII